MTTYIVKRKSDQQEVYRYEYDSPLDMDLFPLAEFDHVEHVEPPAPPATKYGGRRRVTKLEFIELLGDTAYGAILSMAKQSLQVEAWVKKMELATPDADGTSLDLDDPRTQAGVQALGYVLAQQQIVSEDWAAGVLNG